MCQGQIRISKAPGQLRPDDILRVSTVLGALPQATPDIKAYAAVTEVIVKRSRREIELSFGTALSPSVVISNQRQRV